MNHKIDLPYRVMETARAGFPLKEAHGHECVAVHSLPDVPGVACPVQALLEFGNSLAGQTHLWRNPDKDVTRGSSVEVDISHVDQRQLEGQTIARALSDHGFN